MLPDRPEINEFTIRTDAKSLSASYKECRFAPGKILPKVVFETIGLIGRQAARQLDIPGFPRRGDWMTTLGRPETHRFKH